MVDYFLAGDYEKALLAFNDVLSKGFNPLHFIGEVSSHLRNLIVSLSGGLDALLELPDSLMKRYSDQARRCPLKFLYDALGISIQCESGYKASSNPRLHIEFALMRMCFLMKQLEAAPSTASAAQKPAAPKPASAAASVPATPDATPKPAPAVVSAPDAPAAPKSVPAAAPAPEPVAKPAAPASEPPVAPVASAEPPIAPAHASPAVAAPAPAPAENASAETAPAPRRRRTPKTGASLSLSAILDEKEEKQEEEAPIEVSQEIPSDEAVREALSAYAEKFSGKQRLYNMLKSPKLDFHEENGIKTAVLIVVNAAQKKYIEDQLLRDLEGSLRKALSTSLLRVSVDVTPDDAATEKKPYLPGEQASDLISKNEEVRLRVEQMKLDTK